MNVQYFMWIYIDDHMETDWNEILREIPGENKMNTL